MDPYNLAQRVPHLPQRARVVITTFLNTLLARFQPEIVAVTLYGSYARGDADDESDLDLLIVVDRNDPAVRNRIGDVAFEIGLSFNIAISARVRSLEHVQRAQEENRPLYCQIAQEGIMLWTRTYELTRNAA